MPEGKTIIFVNLIVLTGCTNIKILVNTDNYFKFMANNQ